ncbi:pirin family protein, partial [Nocardioides hankookensis]
LPDASRAVDPDFAHHAPEPVTGDGYVARVFLGSLLGDASPVPTYTPLLGAEILLEPGATVVLDVDPAFEHGVLVDAGVLTVDGTETKQHDLAYVPPGSTTLTLTAYDEPVRLLLLGGPPFGESIVMWWNIVARTHEEVVEWRNAWQDQIVDGRLTDGWFGVPVGDERPPIPAPPLPNARLKERR